VKSHFLLFHLRWPSVGRGAANKLDFGHPHPEGWENLLGVLGPGLRMGKTTLFWSSEGRGVAN
jgi:hypothetical protein